MLLPPLKFGEHAVNDINRKSCPHWRKTVAPPLPPSLSSPKKVEYRAHIVINNYKRDSLTLFLAASESSKLQGGRHEILIGGGTD